MTTRRPARAGRRSGIGPWLVVLVVAVLPAAGLVVLARWADGQADAAGGEPAPEPPAAAEAEPGPAMSTGILSIRRLPTVISRAISIEDLRAQAPPFLATLNDRSCAAISVDGVDVGTHNPELAVIPASNQKLVVAAVALEELGDDFTYETTAQAGGEPVDGVIQGDLYLVGGGDPLLSSAWYPTSNLERNPVTSPTSLDDLADQVAADGVRRITGSVLGDGSRYDDELFAPGWGTGVAGLEGGPYDALLVNDSRVLGDELKANDPAEGAAREFQRMLVERGVQVDGTPGVGVAPAGAVTLGSVSSAPLTDVITEMLTTSDNNTAELLVKEIGLSAGRAGTRPAGLEAMRVSLDEAGINVSEIVLADGSGLSLDNRLTCAALLSILQDGDVAEAIAAGLAVAGETGTLSDAFLDHELAGRLVGKTGTLNNPPFNEDPPAVKALAGYVPVDGGGAEEFVLILNGPTISDQSEYRPVWEQLADVLATYPSGPTPAELGPR
jgi:D-alanyl-D-alanine carboxypeptidase/D-alanyl-D-alanine-endopeptidase (penicillin-binding protein 4)